METSINLKKSVIAAMLVLFAVLFVLYQMLNVYAFSVVAYIIGLASLPVFGLLQGK